MNEKTEYYDGLIARYLSGEASPEEIRALETWTAADPAHAKRFTESARAWQAAGPAALLSEEVSAADWRSVRKRTGAAETSRRTFFLPGMAFRIAAAILLLAIPAFLLYFFFSGPASREVLASSGNTAIELPDGTRVTLCQGTKLIYPERFTDKDRTVTLSGEAWFEVQRDTARPFLVNAGDLEIRVLGTAFLVNTNTIRQTAEVILAEGKVGVTLAGNAETRAVLLPGEKAETGPEGSSLTKSVNTDVNFLAWKTRKIVFDNTPLNEATALLSKIYRVNLRVVSPTANPCRITATFDNLPLESVLEVLRATLDLTITGKGTTWELSGGNCPPAI